MTRPARLTVLTAALLVLLPALAILQYRWVGELGDAARERMQRNLHNAAQQFRESFDGEIARAFLGLQVDSGVVRNEAWVRYADRYAAWANTTAYPRLIKEVYLVDADGTSLRLRRWDAAGRTFVPADWEGPLAACRDHFAAELQAFTAGTRRGLERRHLLEENGLLAAPLLNVQIGPSLHTELHGPLVPAFGFTVLALNLPLVAGELLPALARRHFSQADGDAYQVAIVDAADPRTVIYRSSPAAPVEPSRADVDLPIFGAHRDPVMFLARGAARETRDGRNVIVSVIRERSDRPGGRGGEAGRWRLLAQHELGSLDAAVGGVRQRNLAISFGILLLMGITVGLLALTSRRAQALAQQQMEFVAGVSHELRTPVAVIRSAAENLSHGVVGDPDRVRRYGDAIQVEARRLGEMVERVLQYAGIEAGRLAARAPVAVAPLVAEAIDAAARPGGEDVVVERQVADRLPAVLGDAATLRSAIQNLVSNAIKYGGADRWVGVRAAPSPDGREVQISVEDHGRGVAAADLPHIFDPFYRGADAVARQVQGSGLGLALVRRIAEAHGGRVTVATREGAGSTFTLHLPAAAATAQPVALHAPNEAAAG